MSPKARSEQWRWGEERRDWKNGAGVVDPYLTHTLHLWGKDKNFYDSDTTTTWDETWNNDALDAPAAKPKGEYETGKPQPGTFTESGANTNRLIANPDATDHFSVAGAFFGSLWDSVKLYDRDDSGRISEDLQASGYGRASATVVSILAAVGENIGAGALEDARSGRTADNEALSMAQRAGRGALGLGQLTLEALGLKSGGGIFRESGRRLRNFLFPEPVATKVDDVAGAINPFNLNTTQKLDMSKGAFKALKDDIAANGIRNPIKYVEHNGEKYVVDGHHRLRAAKELGLDTIPVERVELPYGGYYTIDDLFNWER